MRLLLPMMLIHTVSAVRLGKADFNQVHTVTSTEDAEQANTMLQEALDQFSTGNLDESMPMAEVVRHVSQRGVPAALAAALSAANITSLPTALLANTLNTTSANEHEEEDAGAADDGAAPKINPVVARIFKIINGMIVQDQNKLVLKVFQCKKQQTAFKSAYRSNRMNFQAQSYKLQEALSSEKLGQLEQFEAAARLRKLIPSRRSVKIRCAADIRQLQCKKQQTAFKSAYRSNRMNFQAESYKLQEALSSEKLGQLEQFEAAARLRKLIPSRRSVKMRCAADIKQLQAEFRRISYDYALAAKIATGTSCAKKPTTTFLQSCTRMVENGRVEAVVEFAEGTEQREMVELMQTSVGRAAVTRGLIEAVGPENLGGEPPARAANITAVPSALLQSTVEDTSVEAAGTDAASDAEAGDDAAPKINPVVARIFKIINGMIIQDQNKLVLKVFQCKKQQTAFKSAYRENRMDFQSESYKLQEALSSEKLGQLEQFEAHARLRKLIPTRNALKRRCAADIRQLQAEFRRISYDYALAAKIASGTSCAKKPKTTFLQSCVRMVEDGRQEAVVEFGEGTSEREIVGLMQTSIGKAAVTRGLIEAVGLENLGGEPLASLYEVSSRRQREAARWLKEQATDEGDDEDQEMNDEEDELAHRETDFNDYFYEDPDYEEESGVIDEPFQPTQQDIEGGKAVEAAVAEISQESEEKDEDLSDKDAPPNGWINEQELAKAEKELLLVGVSAKPKNVTLPKKQVNRKSKMNAKFFCTVANNP
eukprot:CAMPEP_0204506268 /NCGR_PEP_ID=MMETSP0471-20130131/109156_1 /ASSEMBLY_ACC=CAM_ASM_000602 /TAXON_ID=2969 /ORGANISM="Oxyrrhis marina" /LENGTH=765 /DNA_ID=CAMNT_0051511263 /DNA_START=97 /DNA_END=2390 /DNA_ORIENTATION=-